MGWASGSGLFDQVIEILQDVGVDEVTRKEIYEGLIKAFEDFDCDTLDECVGVDPAFDAVWDEKYPEDDDWKDEPEDEDE